MPVPKYYKQREKIMHSCGLVSIHALNDVREHLTGSVHKEQSASCNDVKLSSFTSSNDFERF